MAFANATIIPEPGEHIDITLRHLAKAMQKGATFSAFKRHANFTPRPERRRAKAHAARMRLAKHGRHIPND